MTVKPPSTCTHRKDDTTDTPTTTGRPDDLVTSDDEPDSGDDDADTGPVDPADPDGDWELMQDESRFPAWL